MTQEYLEIRRFVVHLRLINFTEKSMPPTSKGKFNSSLSHADVLRFVTRSSPRTRDKPKKVSVGGKFNSRITKHINIEIVKVYKTDPRSTDYPTDYPHRKWSETAVGLEEGVTCLLVIH